MSANKIACNWFARRKD